MHTSENCTIKIRRSQGPGVVKISIYFFKNLMKLNNISGIQWEKYRIFFGQYYTKSDTVTGTGASLHAVLQQNGLPPSKLLWAMAHVGFQVCDPGRKDENQGKRPTTGLPAYWRWTVVPAAWRQHTGTCLATQVYISNSAFATLCAWWWLVSLEGFHYSFDC